MKNIIEGIVKNKIKERDKSMETIDINDGECQSISASDKFFSCGNPASDTLRNTRNMESSSLESKCQDPKGRRFYNLSLTRRKSNKSLNALTSSFMTRCKAIEMDNKNAEEECSLIEEDQNLSINDPIMCSTFIENKADCTIKNKSDYVKRTGHIKETKNVGKAALNDKVITKKNNELSKEKQNLHKDSCEESIDYAKSTTVNISVPMDLTAMQSVEQINVKRRSNISANNNIDVQKCGVQTLNVMEDSIKTIRSSLNVNTSLDAIDKDNNTTNGRESFTSVQDVDQNALCPTYTSMQVNTSLDDVQRTLQVNKSKNVTLPGEHTRNDRSVTKGHPRPKEETSSLAEINLTKVLRRISEKNQSNVDSKSTTAPEMKPCNPRRISNDPKSHSENKDSPNYIQGTPYPISRSVLLKSYLKFNTMMSCSNSGLSIGLLDSASRSEAKMTSKTDVPDPMKDQTTVVPAYTSATQLAASNDYAEQARSNGTLGDDTLITGEQAKAPNKSPDNNDPLKTNTPAKGKKKLLSLKENSQPFSFSPADSEPSSPKRRRPLRKHRRQKKLTKKTSSPNVPKEGTSAKENRDETVVGIQLHDTDDLSLPQENKKEPRKRRRVLSKKIVVKKRHGEYLLPKLNELGSPKEDEIELNRRMSSLNEFESRKTIPVHVQKCRSQDIFIVATGLSKGDKELVRRTVKSLGGAKIEVHVTHKTTHIVSAGSRTINLLHGIIRGCWLVSLEWVVRSLQSNRWLNPMKYEMRDFSKAVSENRKDRQMFGPSYVSELFTTCGFIYIESNATPSCEALKDLINSAGGRITKDSKKAKIVIGESGLKESWILDSITTGELQSFTKYTRG